MTTAFPLVRRVSPLPRVRRLLAVAALVGLPACGVSGVDGNGHRVDEVREAAAFSHVQSDGALDVELTQGDEQSVVVSIDENLQELVTTRVSDGWLRIDTRKDIGEVVSGPHVLVTVPKLLAARLSGSGNMWADFDQPELPFALLLDGSGVMSFRGKAAAVDATLSGSGDIRLEGTASDVDLDLSGSGAIRGKELEAESGSIELSGSGDISATVSSSVTLALSGSGRINLYGDAHVDGYSLSGSGDIVTH